MSVSSVALVVHPQKQRAVELAKELEQWFEQRGIELTDTGGDLVVSLGGDGTMLRAAVKAHSEDVPLLGVNVGTLGYLTEVPADEAKDALAKVFAGDCEFEERLMLACDVAGAQSFVALNEVLVERASRHLARLRVDVDATRLTTFNSDGIIVATPTGSTAYALSAGGPIVSPRARCLVVVPVSPHMIFARPLVLAPDEKVQITVERGGERGQLSVDGARGCELSPGASIMVSRHPRSLRLVRLAGPGFVHRLRVKLDLPG